MILSLSLFIYLIRDIKLTTRQAKQLTSQLKQSKQQAEKLSQSVIDSKDAFFKGINNQFDVWQLTPREREVALLLIKGQSWPQDSGQSDKWINAPFFGIVDAVEGAKNDQKTSP